MKHFLLIPLSLLVAAGAGAPSLDDLKEKSYPLVERLLTEDAHEVVTHRLDRYILAQHPDKLTLCAADAFPQESYCPSFGRGRRKL